MRVVLYAPQATSAMLHISESLACELALHVEVILYRPNTAGALRRGPESRNLRLVQFKASRFRALRGVAHYSPIRQYRELSRLRSFNPDLIHVFTGEGYLLPALALRLMPAVPMIVTVHDPIVHPGDLIGYATSAARPLVYRRAAAIHVFAEVFRDYLVTRGVPRDRIFVTRLGGVADVFTGHDTEAIEREDAILMFGRLERYKGIDVLVDAGIALEAKGKPRRIIIAGPGRLPRGIRARIAAHPEIFELHNRFISDREAAILLKRSSTCVLPYHQATQSCAPPLALAYQQRIIASRSGAFIEEIPLLGGVLVTPGSVAELTQALDNDRDAPPASANRPDLYAWPAIVDSLVQAYSSTIVRSRRPVSTVSTREPSDESATEY